MELRDYFKIIGKNLMVFLIIVVLGGLSAFWWTKVQPKSYLASTTVTVNKGSSLKQKEINYYLFDNYYNVQSSALFSQIVVSWFESPSLVRDIYQKAGLTLPDIAQNKLAKTFRAARQEPATINVSIGGTNKADLEKLINAATVVLQEKTNELGQNSDSFYQLATFTPIVSGNNPNIVLNTLVGLIAGLIIGLFVTLGIEYFKNEK